ncbi:MULTISPECIES: hypothetical protein [Salinibaculum]|uniref:hypothetical protein n=1 Tax=Salinibaculum TaxID=2732368 RepID=UPI0030D4FC2D
MYDLGRKYDRLKEWMPAREYPVPRPDFLLEGKVVVLLGEHSTEELFGLSAEEMPGERIEEGDSFVRSSGSTNPFLVAAPASTNLHPEDQSFLDDVYESGVSTRIGGLTYGLGVLSTPAGEVAGQSVNPIADMGFETCSPASRPAGCSKRRA